MTLYETWLIVVATGLMYAYLYIFEPFVRFIDNNLNFKPFNCVLCTTFWGAVMFDLILGIDVIYAAFSALIAEFVYRKLVD